MKLFSIIILLFLFVSCETNSNWTQFSGNGLPSKGEIYNNICFVDEQTGYMGGSHLTLLELKSIDTINSQNTAVLYKTLNQGKDWTKIPSHFLGSVEEIIPFGDTIILKIKTNNYETTSLIKTSNSGESWDTLLTFANSSRIIEMQFINSYNARLLITDRHHEFLVNFDGYKLDTLLKLEGDYPWTILNDNVVTLKNVPSTAHYNGYTIRNIRTGKKAEVQFDANYFITSKSKYKDKLYLAARKNGMGYILKITETGFEKIELGKYSKYEPDEVFVYGNKIIALGNPRDEVGPIGVIHSFLISSDNGKSWDKEDLPSPMCIEAPTIYKDKFFISACCPPGFFQVRR